ncbi:hypothetical protein B0H14DRAFT_2625558 [Mycena olivaceomarginata]|nr:hypothetical protein B0H14DRAFT_2625558 [Mycena olivaceomarginata]
MQDLEGNLDLGAPVVCAGYDLEAGLMRENTARMAREDSGCTLEYEDELEDAIAPATSPRVHQPPPAPIGPTTPLTGDAKKKEQKQCRDCAKRKAGTIASLNSTTPPAPTQPVW